MQSNWRYTLILHDGSTRVIDTPDGWDSFTLSYKRNMERHGMFNEIQDGSFKFKRASAQLLRTEYEAYGAQGDVRLQIEQRTKTGFRAVYNGQLAFDTYESDYEQGEYYVSLGCDQIGPYVDLVNRFDQTVDLSANKCFDGVTPLADYPFMNFPITLPSKAVYLQDKATPSAGTYNLFGDTDFVGNIPNSHVNGIIVPKFDIIGSSEITDFTPAYQFDYAETNTQSLQQALIGRQQLQINPKDAIAGVNTYAFDIAMHGTFSVSVIGNGAGSYKLWVAARAYKDSREVLAPVQLIVGGVSVFPGQGTQTHNHPIDYDFIQSLTLNIADPFYIYFITDFSHSTTDGTFKWTSILISFDPSKTHCFINSQTKAPPTFAQVFMAHESLSRIIESLTNNQLQLYSEYLGRPDSQPYSFPAAGCGANRVLTNGKAIRGIIYANDPAFPVTKDPNVGVFTSLKDAFASFKAVDNVGIGLEGSNIRLEHWTHFYQDDVLLSFRNIPKINRKAQASEIYSVFKFGYEKWEAEDSNGLDDFFTGREYHLDISQVSNTLEQVSKFIASGYAIEVTRRKGTDSSDWRYDNDMFMICVEPDGSTYKVELGNIANALNIIDPPTIYNFRISPVRNALRWFSRVIGSYRNVNTGHRIIFGSGDANYKASGQLTSLDCTLEAAILAENQDLTLSTFAVPDDAKPIMWAERVTFSYRLGASQYQQIVANPYGLIEFESRSDKGQGWIEQVDYKAGEGSADFTLIPKIQ